MTQQNAYAIRIQKTGGPEVLAAEPMEPRAPGAGEALVRQTAVGLNFIDTYHRSGLYPLKLPATLGSEAAGVVEAVGEGLTDIKPGDRVADLFLGSGSTLIACEKTARRCFGMELDPKYVDVICRRFQEHTGIKPIAEATGREHDFTGGD
jgi:Zn-dependent alcohol dehydrogenase